ncbi:MAG: hypothetical protein D6748_14340 [Calditrichaeota bacterium]|nr:MAG: hypothetical protein D6748_14340 [Calditrichota bacterium]
MRAPIKISVLIEALEFVFDEAEVYLNTRTGEIVTLETEPLETAPEEDAESLEELREEIEEKCREEVSSDDYILLPKSFEMDEYRLMEEFCLTLPNDELSYLMYSAIKDGKGAFRRFKENLYRYGLDDRWYQFCQQALREYAIKWCEEQGLQYVDDQ